MLNQAKNTVQSEPMKATYSLREAAFLAVVVNVAPFRVAEAMLRLLSIAPEDKKSLREMANGYRDGISEVMLRNALSAGNGGSVERN